MDIKQQLIWPFFILMVLAQLAVPISMINKERNTFSKGKLYKFEIRAIDPSDPFRGKYVIISPKETSYPEKILSDGYGEEVFATFTEDTDGFAKLKELYLEKPDDPYHLIVKARNRHKAKTIISYPFDRYYMNEHKALAAEDAVRATNTDTTSTSHVEVYILNGHGSLHSLKIDNRPIESYLEDQTQ